MDCDEQITNTFVVKKTHWLQIQHNHADNTLVNTHVLWIYVIEGLMVYYNFAQANRCWEQYAP